MNKTIFLTEKEIEFLNKILIEFRAREGIGIESAMGVIWYKINSLVGGSKAIEKFHKQRFISYNKMFGRTPACVIEESKRLASGIISEFNRSAK